MIITNKTLGGKKIDKSDEERFLGVIMDNELSWKAHKNKVAPKISSNTGILYIN